MMKRGALTISSRRAVDRFLPKSSAMRSTIWPKRKTAEAEEELRKRNAAKGNEPQIWPGSGCTDTGLYRA
jgi:hypothetical protein